MPELFSQHREHPDSQIKRPRRKRAAQPTVTKAPAPGRVGIFWWHRGNPLAAAVPLREGVESNQKIDSPLDHFSLWPTIQETHLDLRGVEYEDVPRGRVLFCKTTRTFRVFMDARLHRPEIKQVLRRAFRLERRKVTFATDPHYTTDRAALDRLWQTP